MLKKIQGQILNELDNPSPSQSKLFDRCVDQAEGNQERARQYYLHQRLAEEKPADPQDLDHRENWPMLKPLLILYTLGTIGVLLLVFGFLASRLNWW